MTTARPTPLSPATRRQIRLVMIGAAALGVLIGLGALRLHLVEDPLADVRAYYDAGARLNAGLPLYEQEATTEEPAFYRYPPLLAIAFRPLALLPYEAAALVWEAVVLIAFALTLYRLGRSERILIALGMLGMPIAWTLAIGQAQAPVTLLLTLGSPWAVALAGHLKLLPWLAAVYWVGRRDLRALGRFVAWVAAFAVLQLALEPEGTLAYLQFPSLAQVGAVANNLSPYAVSPALWVLFVVLGLVLALRLAPTRWGWAAAVALSVGATPRMSTYQLSTLLAAFGGPREGPAVPTAGAPTAVIPVDPGTGH